MSLNHIVYEKVSDDQKLDVKFKSVYCDQVITGSGPSPSPTADGYVNMSGATLSSGTPNLAITNTPSFIGIKNHSTFQIHLNAEIQFTASKTTYKLYLTLPTAIQNYFTNNPSAYQSAYVKVNGNSYTIVSSADFIPSGMYYANSAVKISNAVVEIDMYSQQQNGTGFLPNEQNLNLSVFFSGPSV